MRRWGQSNRNSRLFLSREGCIGRCAGWDRSERPAWSACFGGARVGRRLRDADPQGRSTGHRRGRRREAERPVRRPGLRPAADSARPDRAPRRRWTRPARCGRACPRGIEADPSGFFSSGVLKPSPVKELVSKFGEAVISIETPSGKGSGFLINKDGYAITNAHVIQGETRISAILYQNVPERPVAAPDRGRRDRRAQSVLRPGAAQAAAPGGPETQPRRAG